MLLKLFLILFQIGFGVTLNLVGTISVSEIFLVIASPFFIKPKLFVQYPLLKKISYLYIGLLAAQILSEIFVGSGIANSLKGIAVTVMSYLHFMFLFRYFIKDRKIILWIFIGVIARFAIFGTEHEGTMDEVLSGEGAIYLKFYVVRFISSGLFIASLFIRQRQIAILSAVIGLIVVILGARSSGGMFAITGIMVYFIIANRRRFTRAQLIRTSVIGLVIGYGFFALYVSNVLNGNITSGNSWQLKRAENPYNPINTLMMGRSETFIGAMAFADAPLFGHGAWSPDPTGKYHRMQLEFVNSNTDVARMEYTDVIPAHSVIIGAGTNNGILAFVFMVAIFYFFISKGIKSVRKNDAFLYVTVAFIFALLWNGLFSPQSHFRFNMPPYFAFLLASYIINSGKIIVNSVKNENLLYNNR
ncbi:MAG: hypothetical protein LBS01_02640 [Prevotellaceae bacterium]|jgi:hypothetical protein|nr:hypothetical protein [Prevotellaceae bacterium]